jgi:hypothetical protein
VAVVVAVKAAKINLAPQLLVKRWKNPSLNAVNPLNIKESSKVKNPLKRRLQNSSEDSESSKSSGSFLENLEEKIKI